MHGGQWNVDARYLHALTVAACMTSQRVAPRNSTACRTDGPRGQAWRGRLIPGSQNASWWGAAATVAFVLRNEFAMSFGVARLAEPLQKRASMRFLLARTDGVMTVTERLP